jgi:hypothetical protein
MLISNVAAIMGHYGMAVDQSDSDGYRDEDRSYETCGEFDSAIVGFSADRHSSCSEDAKPGYFG